MSLARAAKPTAAPARLHRVLEVKMLTSSAYVLRVERGELKFKAGQCVNIGVPGAAVNREYSTYSGENDERLDFLIKEVEGGIISVALKRLRPGDLVEIHGSYGEFCLKESRRPDQPYLFIASGTGIAPFHSFVKSHPGLNYKILHGIRHAEESYDRQDYDPARYVSCVSRGDGGDFHGRLTDYLKKNPVQDHGIISYLCGNRAMVGEAYDLLRDQGVPSAQLFTEVFF